MNYLQPVRLAGLVRCWIVKKYCWLVWCERKILFRLEIYDLLGWRSLIKNTDLLDFIKQYSYILLKLILLTSSKLWVVKLIEIHSKLYAVATG